MLSQRDERVSAILKLLKYGRHKAVSATQRKHTKNPAEGPWAVLGGAVRCYIFGHRLGGKSKPPKGEPSARDPSAQRQSQSPQSQ